jgi:hypothetical protein
MFEISPIKPSFAVPNEDEVAPTSLRMPVRVQPLQGEPLLSLLTRSALANGFYRVIQY